MIAGVQIAIVGFGLIGGSIARALRRSAGHGSSGDEGSRTWIAAWSRGRAGPERAVSDGVVDVAPRTLAEAVGTAELIVLATPPLACLDLLTELADLMAPATGALPSSEPCCALRPNV